jgi:O-antigen/teichoic acid export membrane protein
MNTVKIVSFLKQKLHNLIYDARFSEILVGSVWSLGARVIATILALVFNIIVARYYGAQFVGIVAIINSFLMLVNLFTVLGTPTSILRLIPEQLARYSPTSAFKVYRKTQYMVICISLITATIFFFSANLVSAKIFSKPHLSYYFALASLFIVFQSLMSLNTQAVRGLRLIKLFALMQLLPQSFNLLFLITIGLLWPTNDIPVYAVLSGFTITGVAGWFIIEVVFKKRMRPDDNVCSLPGRTIIFISLPMFMTGIMAFIIAQSGVILLGMFLNEAEVGYYAIAVKVAGLTTFFLTAINSMAGPTFSELFYLDKVDELFHVAKKSAKLIFMITTPILMCLIVFGKPLLVIIFGKEFAKAYPALVLLVMGQFVNSISGSTGMFMDMTGNQNILRNFMIIAACLSLVINLWLIPIWGINGAALASMISTCFLNLSLLFFMKLKFGRTTGYFPFLNLDLSAFRISK